MDNAKLKSRLATKAQALQEAPAEREPASLVPVENGYAALNSSTLDLIRENLKEQPLTYQMFDVVKSPSGGSTVFTVPGLSGDEAEKELTGIILDYTTPRAYWDTPDPVEGTPPTCLSKGLFLKYAARLTSTLTPLNGVVTRITLQKATSRGGKPYALFHFEAMSALGPEEAASAKAFARQLMEAVKASEVVPKLEAAG